MPSLLTRVSDFIPEITDYIDKIQENGMAYTTNGSVYFDTQAFRQAACFHRADRPPSHRFDVHLQQSIKAILSTCGVSPADAWGSLPMIMATS